MSEHTFDYPGLLDEFRCHTTEWVRAERDRVVRERRTLHVRELALTRVLDERGQIDDSLAEADGVSVRAVRDALATARALEDLPTIARVAAEGGLSDDQLSQVVKVADPGNLDDDRRWAAEAPGWTPADLAQHARTLRTPTTADAAARRDARTLRFWDRPDRGMVAVGGELPDLDGVLVRSVFEQMIQDMRPAKGQPWETPDRRMADALVELCRNYADVHAVSGPSPHLVVEVPLTGPATVAGIPLPDRMVERLRAEAKAEPVLVDETGTRLTVGRIESVLSEKTKRVIKQRDGKCRWPGCDRRVGLEIHHLWPRSWGGTDDKWNLATVCTHHHARLAPQGPLLLLGNPNHPAGLSLIDRDDLPALATLAAERVHAGPGPQHARAGPGTGPHPGSGGPTATPTR